MSEQHIPPEGTVERWAWDFISSTALTTKLAPPSPPTQWASPSRRWALHRPGRPPELVQRTERKKAAKGGALKNPSKRAEVLHTFLHHELQAAELMAWAILAFPDTPEAFRRGLLGICQDELRHMGLYRAHLETLGHPFGSLPIKDWFWERVPGEEITPAHFVARMGVGFEGGNLDHGARFTAYFEAAGDPRAAAIQEQITQEEIAHAAFALHWFRAFTGELNFEQWRAFLPAPITPSMTRGTPLNLEARRRAGYPDDFLEKLEHWSSPAPGGGPGVQTVAWVLNLDAEDELSHEGAHTPTAAMTARIEALIPRLSGLISPGDQIVWPGARAARGLSGRAWCPTPWALERLTRAGAVLPRAPSLEVLRRVNHRRFSHQLGQTLAGAGYAENLGEVERLLASRAGEWLLKRPYGYAGRGRRKVRAGELTAADHSWLEASLRTGGGLQVEPFMQLELDCALHGWLAEDGACTLGQPTLQEVDATGAWQSTRLATELTATEVLVLTREARSTGEALHRAGYFGPFGIDGFRWRAAEGGGFQPRSEINARYSMGWAIGMGDFRLPLGK